MNTWFLVLCMDFWWSVYSSSTSFFLGFKYDWMVVAVWNFPNWMCSCWKSWHIFPLQCSAIVTFSQGPLITDGRIRSKWTGSFVHSCTFIIPALIIIKNWVPSILTHNLWLIFMGMKQKKIKIADSKKLSFPKPPILNIFCENFMDWSLD